MASDSSLRIGNDPTRSERLVRRRVACVEALPDFPQPTARCGAGGGPGAGQRPPGTFRRWKTVVRRKVKPIDS